MVRCVGKGKLCWLEHELQRSEQLAWERRIREIAEYLRVDLSDESVRKICEEFAHETRAGSF